MPENTLSAMEKALELNVNTLEMDVVITADDLTRTWKQIVNFNTDKEYKKDTIPGTKVFVPAKAKRYVPDQDEELIIDERGVRLAPR